MNILSIPCANHFPGRAGQSPRWIILHGTAGGSSAQAIANYFISTQGTQNPVSSNYIIGTDGTIVCSVDPANGAWANGYLSTGHDSWWSASINPNLQTISIEHCKPDTANATALTPAQEAASFWLVDYLCSRYNIPRRAADAAGGITGHYSIDPINRQRCPGTYPFDRLWTALKGSSSVGTTPPQGWPLGWHDDGTTLTAPNGHKVIGGFRQYIYHNFWDDDDYPLGEETNMGHLELGNPSLGGGVQQIFRKSMLELPTGGKTILRAWTGQEVAACRSIITQLNNTISDLNQQIAQLKSQQEPAGTASTALADAVVNSLQSMTAVGDELMKTGDTLKTLAAAVQKDLQGVH